MKKPNIICVNAEKGGVGKTTTVINIGAALAMMSRKVLLVDLDQQAHLSSWLGYDNDNQPTISDLLFQAVSNVQTINYSMAIRHNETNNLDYIPTNNMLSGILGILGTDSDSVNVMKRIFSDEYFAEYDYIIFDTAGTINLLSSNALTASDKVIIPMQAEFLSYEGVGKTLSKILSTKQAKSLDDFLLGIVTTMFDVRTSISKEVFNSAKESYGKFVFEQAIPLRAEAKNTTITQTSSVLNDKSDVGKAYISIAKYIMSKEV